MKAKVDPGACTGCGLCEATCPLVFEIRGEFAVVIVDVVPAEAEETCREAEEFCPEQAITVIE